MERLQCQDREHARHQVEQYPAGQRAEDGEQDGARPRPLPARHRSWHRVKLESAPVAERQDAVERRGIAAAALELGDQQVAVALEDLRRGIIDRAVGRGKEIRLADRRAGRDRDRQAQRPGGQREMRDRCKRARQGATEIVEPRIDSRRAAGRHIERHDALFGNANLFGACQPVQLGGEMLDAARPRWRFQAHQDGIIFFVNEVRNVGDEQLGRHRIAHRPDRPARRQRPFDRHRLARVAGVGPVTVPARRGAHRNREINLAARQCMAVDQ